jgi:hypothetical protein
LGSFSHHRNSFDKLFHCPLDASISMKRLGWRSLTRRIKGAFVVTRAQKRERSQKFMSLSMNEIKKVTRKPYYTSRSVRLLHKGAENAPVEAA